MKLSEGKLVSSEPLLDWLLDHYESFGCRIELITDNTSAGSQFCKGFGGIGALLRYPLALDELGYEEDASDEKSEKDEDTFDF
jgi:peptide chain release factor subunit 1